MRQLLNKARFPPRLSLPLPLPPAPSPVYDIRYRFMRPSPLHKARANKKKIDRKIHSAREMEIIAAEQDSTLIMV